MLKRIVCITFSTVLLLTSISCSSSNNKMERGSDTKSSISESSTTCLKNIIIYNGDLNDSNNYNMTNYMLELNIHSTNSTYNFSGPKNSCEFSKEKGEEFFDKFQKYDKKEYEPYHANEDGVMVKQYEPFTVQTFNVLKLPNGKYKIDQTENASGHFFTLSESDYNSLVNDFKELEKLAEKSAN